MNEEKATLLSRRSFQTSLLLGTAFGALGFALPAFAKDPMNVYFRRGYNYCDAKQLAAYWSVDIGQAKSNAGQKIIEGYESTLRSVLRDARRQTQCEWEDTGLQYEDADKLASYWGLDDAGQAKDKIATLYTNGNSKRVARDLRSAGGGE